jgi:hypothetical protein
MKVDLKKFVNLLDIVSVGWSFEPVVVDFGMGGGVAFNVDPSMSIATYVVIPTVFAVAYEPIGKIIVDEVIYKKIKRYLKGEADIKVDGGKLIIKGTTDVLEVNMPSIQSESLQPEFIQTEDGIFAKKIEVDGIYTVDISPLSDVTAEETVSLKFTSSGVIVKIGFDIGSLEKTLMSSAKKTVEGTYTYDAKLIKAIASLVSTPVTVAVPKQGNAPLQIYYSDKVIPLSVTYVLAPRVVA